MGEHGERLSVADVSFLQLERRAMPQHVGELALFEPPAEGFDYDRLVALLEERIALVPRYRQRVREVPGHIANPVWIDDPDFDITYHVRHSAMPRPGSEQQLLDFCARIQSRLLDRARPLWEMYLVEGLGDGRVAVITKTHHAMVDGLGAIDIAQVILDASAATPRSGGQLWMPEPTPSPAGLVLDALRTVAHRPAAAMDAMRLGAHDLRAGTSRFTSIAGGMLDAARAVIHPAPRSALTVELSEQRRVALARTKLADYRTVRAFSGGTVNDVALTTVSGALRGWLLFRGEEVRPSATVRALVPVSVDDQSGGRVSALLVDLPVGEPDPLLRLARIGYAMSNHRASGRSVDAEVLVALGGFAPPTLHALGARAASSLARRMFNLVVTNVPGPQEPRYAAGARLSEVFPILPLGPGQAVSIGLTSYDGGVYFGINSDRDAVPDVEVLASLIEESLAELVAASPRTPGRPTRPRVRAPRRRGAADARTGALDRRGSS